MRDFVIVPRGKRTTVLHSDDAQLQRAFRRALLPWTCYIAHMTSKVLDQAIAKAHELPDADQERIGREINDYVEGLRRLRSDLDQGIKSLDAGLGKELDIEDVIARANALYARG